MENALILTIPLALILWVRWFASQSNQQLLPLGRFARFVLYLLPVLCLVALLAVLATLSAKAVRKDFFLIVQYTALGAVWLRVSQLGFAFLGVSMRDDVLERRNPSAAWMVAGQFVAVTFCFVGANVGEGPGPEVVLFCALVSTLALFLLWLLFDRIAGASETVTIDRDDCAGIRVAGWLVAVGIVCGAAVAGDWRSALATLLDFVGYVLPALVFTLVAAFLERMMRARPTGGSWNNVNRSVGLAAVFIGCATLYVWKRGLH